MVPPKSIKDIKRRRRRGRPVAYIAQGMARVAVGLRKRDPKLSRRRAAQAAIRMMADPVLSKNSND
jgi:hypothetical protein